MYKVISFGYRCSSASFLQLLNLKTESYPFDWLVSKLDVIKDCIETKFVHFLNANHYVARNTETVNIIDNTITCVCNEVAHVNMYYEKDMQTKYTYSYQLACNHRTIQKDCDYYQRCINRLYSLFKSNVHKYYLHFHPIMGINDYQHNKEMILKEFDDFNQYIIGKTRNIFGIYFILIKHKDQIKSFKWKETRYYNVFVLYCNDDFLDGGAPFMGNDTAEKEEVLSILKKIFI